MYDDSVSTLKVFTDNAKQGIRKFKSLYGIYGFWGTLDQVRKSVIFFETVCRLDKNLSISEQPVQPKIPLQIEILSKELDIHNWAGRREILEIRGEYGLEQFSKRFDRGDLCFTAYTDDDFVGFIWIEFPPVTEAGYVLLNDEAFTYDGWTFEKFRGNRTMPVIQQAINNYVRANRADIRSLVTHVSTWNKASLSGDQRAGYKIIRLELTIVIFGFHKKMVLNKEIPSDLIMHQG